MTPLTVSRRWGHLSRPPEFGCFRTWGLTLSLPAGTTGFDYQALTLTDNGGPNLITSDVTVTALAVDDTYVIGRTVGPHGRRGQVHADSQCRRHHGSIRQFRIRHDVDLVADGHDPAHQHDQRPAIRHDRDELLGVSAGADPNGSANNSPPSGIATFAIYGVGRRGAYSLLGHQRPPIRPLCLAARPAIHTASTASRLTTPATSRRHLLRPSRPCADRAATLRQLRVPRSAQSARNSDVTSIDVTFSEPINTNSLAAGALTLSDDGGKPDYKRRLAQPRFG